MLLLFGGEMEGGGGGRRREESRGSAPDYSLSGSLINSPCPASQRPQPVMTLPTKAPWISIRNNCPTIFIFP